MRPLQTELEHAATEQSELNTELHEDAQVPIGEGLEDGDRAPGIVGTAAARRIREPAQPLVREELQTTFHPWQEADPYYEHVSETLHIELQQTRRACVEFNQLDEVARQIFFHVAIDGKAETWCAAEGFGTLEQVEEHLSWAKGTLGTY